MADRGGWKTIRPDEQLLQLARDVEFLLDVLPQYTKLQGMRLETRVIAGARHLYAVVDDPGATNDGVAYALTP